MRIWWFVTSVAVAGCVPSSAPPKYNASNGYGRPTDSKYVSYFDQATEGPTKDSLLGKLPASLSGFDRFSGEFNTLATPGPNTLNNMGLNFERVDGDKICFSKLELNVDLEASADRLVDDFKRAEFVVHTIANRAAIETAQIWPVEGSKLTEFEVTDDTVKDKGTYRERRFEITACGAKPANIESAEFLAVVIGGEVSGQTPNGLLLWRLVK